MVCQQIVIIGEHSVLATKLMNGTGVSPQTYNMNNKTLKIQNRIN